MKAGRGSVGLATSTWKAQAGTLHQPVGLRTALLALLTAALWGGNPVAVSYSVDSLPPVAVAAVRFAMAAIFMAVWCRVAHVPLRLQQGQFVPAFVAGVLMFVQIASFNWGVVYSNSSHSSTLINTAVFWVAAFEHFVTRTDRLTRRKSAGLVIAAAGVAIMLATTPQSSHESIRDKVTAVGDAVLLGSAILLAWKLVYIRHVLRVIEPEKLIFWHNMVGLVGFTCCSALFEKPGAGQLTTSAVLGLIYQGVLVAGVCFAIQAILLRRHTASQISVFGFATPLFGVGLGVLLRGDPLSLSLLVAALAVATGIALVSVSPRMMRAR